MKSKLAKNLMKQADIFREGKASNALHKAIVTVEQAAITIELLEETVDEYKKDVSRLTECRDLYKKQLERCYKWNKEIEEAKSAEFYRWAEKITKEKQRIRDRNEAIERCTN